MIGYHNFILQSTKIYLFSTNSKIHYNFILMFRIIQKIGSGSFGDVFQAIREIDGECVALKVVPKYGTYLSREIQILQQISHPNVVSILSSFYCKVNYGPEPKESLSLSSSSTVKSKFKNSSNFNSSENTISPRRKSVYSSLGSAKIAFIENALIAYS